MFPRFVRRGGIVAIILYCGGVFTLGGTATLLEADAQNTVYAAEESHETAAGKGDHSAPSGPPLSFKEDLAIWSLVTFIIFVVILKSAAWGPLSNGLQAREARIRSDLDEAAEARRQAEKLLAEHTAQVSKTKDEIAELLAEARRDSEDLKKDILTAAQKDAETTRNRAVEEINRARDAAVKDLFDHISRAVVDATEQILGRTMSGADQDRLVEEALAQFAERK